jgi:tetratricopeptide (TPR) repeat protein
MDLSIEQALKADEECNFQEAERIYRAILEAHPKHPDANHNLALILASNKSGKAALPLFKTAHEANPNVEQYWLSYIDALISENQLEKANEIIFERKKLGLAGENVDVLEAQLTKIMLAQPSKSVAQSKALTFKERRKKLSEKKQKKKNGHNITDGNADPTDLQTRTLVEYYNNRNYVEAEQLALLITQKFPSYQLGWKVLGAVFSQTDRKSEAVIAMQRAVQISNQDFQGHYNLGVILHEIKRLEEAELSYRQAIALKSDYANAYGNLGVTLYDLGRLEEAEAAYREAIALQSNYPNAHNNLGNTLKDRGKLEEARASYRQAISFKPDYALAHSNLGNVLKELGELDEAEVSYRLAIDANAYFSDARYNLGVLLFDKKQFSLAEQQFGLVDNTQSKLYSIRCLYELSEKTGFLKKLDDLINDGAVNAVIGSLACCSEIRFGVKKLNPFCNDPLEYVVKTDLYELCDFDSIFLNTSRDILSDNSVSKKHQTLLSNGIQTAGNIFVSQKFSDTEIEAIIRLEIEKYKIRFEGSSEGFINNWPASYNISGWLVSMQSGGKLDSHMHDAGWISGSVYINVPPKVRPDSGNLVVCSSDDKHVTSVEERQENSVDVVTGTLCLFPSSLHHYTVPFEDAENRIVLAFDVIPKSKI